MNLFDDLRKKLMTHNLNKHHYAPHIINGNFYWNRSAIYMEYFKPTPYDTIDTKTFNGLSLGGIKYYTILRIKGFEKHRTGLCYGYQCPYFFTGKSIIKVTIDNVEYYLYLKFKVINYCETCDCETNFTRKRFIISKNLTNLLKFIYTTKQVKGLLHLLKN